MRNYIDVHKAKEVYTSVKVRGMAQGIFRQTLLDVYKGKCAFCNFKVVEALEAAHIIPWHYAGDEDGAFSWWRLLFGLLLSSLWLG